MHRHFFVPFPNSFKLYCQECAYIKTSSSSVSNDLPESNIEEEQKSRSDKSEFKELEEESEDYQTMEAELLAQMRELYPNQYPTDNIAIRPEYEEGNNEDNAADDYEGLIY